ncbi:ATP-binding protein, partial [Clostridioides difficile]
ADENNNLGKPSIYICNNDGSENIFHSVLEKEAIKEAFRTGNPVGIGTKYCKNSSAYYFPIKGQESNVLGVIGVACFKIDIITENEKILLEAVSTQVALAIDRENLFEKNKKANLEAERERLRGNLLRSISHDLRTPLTSILGSSSTILENDDVIDKETRVELLKNIYEDTSWLTHSVENILSMTRIDEGKLDIEKRPEVVDEIIAESILRVKKFANSRDIKTNIPDEIIIVHVDVLLIEQVLVNLIDNAIRHTPKNSKIELTVKKESNQVLFEVADNGKGIPNEDIGNIFNRFYTKNKSRNLERRGIGLGLEICKSIVEAHGGEIVAFNNPSGGATFRFSIPMYDEEGKDKWK